MSTTIDDKHTNGAAVATESVPNTEPRVSDTPAAPPRATSVTPLSVEAPPVPAKRRPPVALFIVAALAVVGISLGARQYVWGLSHVSTDNAQVEGHVIPVLAKVSGFVTAINIQDNQSVTQGQPLVQLDDREYRAKLAQNDAELGAARAMAGQRGNVGQAVAQIDAARAAVDQARANAERTQADVLRYRELAPRGIISRQQLDAAEAAAVSAAAQLDAASRQVLSARAALSGADAKLAAAQAQRDASELNVAWTSIASPSTGVVSKKSVEVGQLVSPGQPLMAVVPLGDVWVVANLKETELENVTPGDHAEIEVDAYPHHKFAAHVESISPATGATFSMLPPDNATGNFTKVVQRIPVRLRLDGAQDPRFPLRPGMSVQATINTK